jgi:hypothetical protein
MRLPRMTTRRWMDVVAGAAILAASCVWAQRLIRYDSAWHDYMASTQWYEEGRLLPGPLVLRSQRVMEAQLDLSVGREQQIRAITAHFTRVSGLIQAEINEPLGIHDRPDRVALEIGEALGKCKLPLQEWLTAPEVKEGLAKCHDQLKKLKEKW